MNFSEALILLKQGESIRRSNWSSNEYIFMQNGVVYQLPNLQKYMPTQRDILADNWQIC